MIAITLVWGWAVRGSTDQVLAVVLTCGTGWGLADTTATYMDVRRERAALRSRERPDRALVQIANANVRREFIRILGFASIFTLALTVVLGVSFPALGRGLLILLIVLMIVNARMDRIERDQTRPLLHAVAARDQHDAEPPVSPVP